MRFHRLLAGATATALLTLGFPSLAAADDSDDSTVTLQVEGGALEISVKDGSTSLGTVRSSAEGTTVSGRLGQVVVTDERNAPAGSGWVASVESTDFQPRRGSAISASKISYLAGPIEKDGTATVTGKDPRNLRRSKAVVTATNIEGNNTASWYPTIEVDIPPGLVAGEYAATITHSVM
ncbi:MAG: hypothetical protein ACLGIF_11510 [Actinomycetes bacterium]